MDDNVEETTEAAIAVLDALYDDPSSKNGQDAAPIARGGAIRLIGP